LLLPLPIALMLGMVSVFLATRGRRRAAFFSAIAAGVVAYASSIGLVADALLRPLENAYTNPSLAPLHAVSFVVVLGSGYQPRDGVPLTGALADDGLARIVEGVRILRRLPTARMVLSGGAADGLSPSAVGYALLAQDLGVDSTRLDILDRPLDTHQEAQAVAALVGSRPFILVTSAYHMPRAMRLMALAGAHPIAAPTGQLCDMPPLKGWRKFVPTSGGLRKTERAIHEYLGLAALKGGMS
jgi:uncharacterized SAM-binding protein YcdF (DUF218 family)